jgi:hypothetical protein
MGVRVYACLAGLLLAGVTACGRTPQQQAQQQAQSSVKDMAQGLEAMAKGMQEMAGAANQKPVEPVSFKDLQTLFPDLSGWEKGEPTGEKMTSPVSYSQAAVTYRKDDASVDGKIVDSGFNQLIVAPLAMMLAAGYEKESGSGYEKSVKLGSYPGFEKWNKSDKNGELNAVVNKRFVITYEGRGIDDTKVLYDLLQKTDLNRLAAVK